MFVDPFPTVGLLPCPQPRNAGRRGRIHRLFAVAAGLGVLIVLAVGAYLDSEIAMADGLDQRLAAENAGLDAQVRAMSALRDHIEALAQRRAAIEGLQRNRNRPVRLLEMLARRVPSGVYLTALKQVGAAFTIAGIAQSNERISALLRNLNQVAWLDKAELIESRSVTEMNSLSEERRLFAFSMRFAYRASLGPEASHGDGSDDSSDDEGTSEGTGEGTIEGTNEGTNEGADGSGSGRSAGTGRAVGVEGKGLAMHLAVAGSDET